MTGLNSNLSVLILFSSLSFLKFSNIWLWLSSVLANELDDKLVKNELHLLLISAGSVKNLLLSVSNIFISVELVDF